MTRILRNITATIAGIAVIALIFLVVYDNRIRSKAEENTASSQTEVTESADEAIVESSDEAKTEEEFSDYNKIIAVDLSKEDLAKIYNNYSDEFDDISMPSRSEERTSLPAEAGWHKKGEDRMFDAVADPFDEVKIGKTTYSKDDIVEMKDELYEAIMRNPVMGDMVAQWLDTIDEENVNPWIDVMLAEYQSYGPETFLTHREGEGDKIFVTEEYQRYAKHILTFMDRCVEQGVKTISTWDFWYLNDALEANDVRTLRNKDKSYLDNYPALTFMVETKDGKAKLRFGFNIYDKRLEVFEARTPKAKVTPPPAKKIKQPRPAYSPSPDPDDPPGVTPIPTPSKIPCDPQEDPVHKGNADVGGGQNQPGDGPGPEQPKDPATDESGGHKDPATVTPTSPVPSPQPGEEPPAVDENPIDYEVDPVPTEPTTGNDGAVDIGSEPPGEEFDEPPIG